MAYSRLHLVCLLLSFAWPAEPQLAQVEIRFNCRQWNIAEKSVPCDLFGRCRSNVSVCFCHKGLKNFQERKDFSQAMSQCSTPKARQNQKEVLRFKTKIWDTSADLFFIIRGKRVSTEETKTHNLSVRLLPNLKATSNHKWFRLVSTPSVEDFMLVFGRLTCLPLHSGPFCTAVNHRSFMSQDHQSSNKFTFSLETILAAIAAGCCFLVLLGLTVWCGVKRLKKRENRESTDEPDIYDVYEQPYDDEYRASYMSLGHRDGQGNGTLESTIEEGPQLPPRRVSISSEDFCSRGEEDEDLVL